MNNKFKCNKWLVLTLAVIGGVFATSAAFGDDMTAAEKRANRLRAEADRIETAAKRAEHTKDIVNGVLADSMNRVSLRDEAPVTVDVYGFLQTRFLYQNDGGSSDQHGFDIDRARIGVRGTVYDKFNYDVSGEWSDYTNTFELKDAFVSTELGGFDLKIGQFVTSFYSGYVSDPTTLVNGDYTISALTFGQGRSQGFELGRSFGDLSFKVSYNDGFGTDNGASIGDNGYGLSARVDYALLDSLNLGAAFAYQNTDVDYSTYTLDVSYTISDFTFSGAWVSDNRSDSWDNYSLVGTAAYNFTDSVQGFGQYEYGVITGASSDLSVLTVGVNYDINPNVRWTNSVGYALDAIDSSAFTVGNSGWSGSGLDGEYVVKSMITVSF